MINIETAEKAKTLLESDERAQVLAVDEERDFSAVLDKEPFLWFLGMLIRNKLNLPKHKCKWSEENLELYYDLR